MLVRLQIVYFASYFSLAPSEASVRASRMRRFFQNIPRIASESPSPQTHQKKFSLNRYSKSKEYLMYH